MPPKIKLKMPKKAAAKKAAPKTKNPPPKAKSAKVEKGNKKVVVPKAVVPKAMVPKAVVPKAVVPKAVVPKDVVPKDVVPKAMVPKAVVPKAVVPKDVVPKAVVPKAVVPKVVVPKVVEVKKGPAEQISNGSEPRIQNDWWIVRVGSEDKNDFILQTKCPIETESLKVNGQGHTRILSLGREKPLIWCRKPSFLRVTLEYEDGSNKTALLRTQSMFDSQAAHKPFHGVVLNRNPSSIVKFIELCDATFDAIQVPDQVSSTAAARPANKENKMPNLEEEDNDDEEMPTVEPVAEPVTPKPIKKTAQPVRPPVTPKPKKEIANTPPDRLESPEPFVPPMPIGTRTRKKDKVTSMGNDDMSDFEDDEPEFKEPKLQRDIANAVHKLAHTRKKDAYAEENAKFQTHVAGFEGGTVSGFIGNLKSVHDPPDDDEELQRIYSLYPQRSMIDRPLDRHHVEETESNAKNFRHLTLHGNNLLAIFFGSVKEFRAASKKANSYVDSLRKRGIPITLDTSQTAADFGNMIVIGGTHRLAAYKNILKENGNDVAEVNKLYGKFISRLMVTVYCTHTVDEEGTEKKLLPKDLTRLARSHNRPAPPLPKSYFDYLMTFRHMIFVRAGMPDAPLNSDLPTWWNRAFTQEVYNHFIDAMFPNPATPSDRTQFNKAKDVVELSGEGFGHLMTIYTDCREVVVDFMDLKVQSKSKDGSMPAAAFPQIIDVNHLAAPVTGLNDDARETVIAKFRDFVEKRLQVIRTRRVGLISELTAMQNVLVRKCEKIKKRQLFMMGFADRTECPDFDSLTEAFPVYTQRKHFDNLLDENVQRVKKNAVFRDMPKRWQIYYDRAVCLTNAGPQRAITGTAAIGSKILRESMFGAVVLLDKLDVSAALKEKPRDAKFTGVSTVIFSNLSKMELAHGILESIHNNLAQNMDYTLICLNDTVANLTKFTDHYGFVTCQLYVNTASFAEQEPKSADFGMFDPFSYVTLLYCFRERIKQKLKIKPSFGDSMPCSRLLDFPSIYHEDFAKVVIDRVTPTDGWILDCAAIDGEDFILIAKATLTLRRTVHLFIWTPPERLFDETDFDGFQDLIDKHMAEVQKKDDIFVDEGLRDSYNDRKLALANGTADQPLLAANRPGPSTKNSKPDNRRSESPDVEFLGVSPVRDIPSFCPVSSEWQINTCSTLAFQMIEANEFEPVKKEVPISSLIPQLVEDVPADGNCLFSAISQAVTGDPFSSTRVRTMVCDYLKENCYDRMYLDLLDGETVKQYVKRMYKPCLDATDRAGWATQVELQILAHILKTDIWTFMSNELNQPWWRYKARTHILPYEAIYLQNQDSHYTLVLSTVPRPDVVTETATDSSDESDGREGEEQKDPSSECGNQEKSVEMKSPDVQNQSAQLEGNEESITSDKAQLSPVVEQNGEPPMDQNGSETPMDQNGSEPPNDGSTSDEEDLIESSFLEPLKNSSSAFDLTPSRRLENESGKDSSSAKQDPNAETPNEVREAIHNMRIARHLKGEVSLMTDTCIRLNTPLTSGSRKHMQSTPVTMSDTSTINGTTMSVSGTFGPSPTVVAPQDQQNDFVSPRPKKSRLVENVNAHQQETEATRHQVTVTPSEQGVNLDSVDGGVENDTKDLNGPIDEGNVSKSPEPAGAQKPEMTDSSGSHDSLNEMTKVLDTTGL